MESVLDTSQVRNAKDYANGQINSFIEHVEELTHALKDVDTPEIARVRAKVKIAVAAAKSALSDGASVAKSALSDRAAQVRTHAVKAGKTTDTFVRDNPWQVVGIAALLGVAVGVLASRSWD